jgi:hypothetical protein
MLSLLVMGLGIIAFIGLFSLSPQNLKRRKDSQDKIYRLQPFDDPAEQVR